MSQASIIRGSIGSSGSASLKSARVHIVVLGTVGDTSLVSWETQTFYKVLTRDSAQRPDTK